MIRLAAAHMVELHSLSRYPPIGLDDTAIVELERAGLVTCTQRCEYLGQRASRWRLTDAGKVLLHQTALLCAIPHCPCHGGAPTSDVVERLIDDRIDDRIAALIQ